MREERMKKTTGYRLRDLELRERKRKRERELNRTEFSLKCIPRQPVHVLYYTSYVLCFPLLNSLSHSAYSRLNFRSESRLVSQRKVK